MTNFNIHSTFFHSTEDAVSFLLEHGFVAATFTCNCGGTVKLIQNTETPHYRCTKKVCRKRFGGVFKNSCLDGFKIKPNDALLALYFFCFNLRNFQAAGFIGISEPTLVSLKKRFLLIAQNYSNTSYRKIGGQGIRVQVDETVLVRGRLIRNPSGTHDAIPNSVWLVGGIEETDEKRIFLKIVPNRRIETMSTLLSQEIEAGSILVTDGYPSYPQAANNCNFLHLFVNHNSGFVNRDGDHTNLIENVWSHLKSHLRTVHGVLRADMESFVAEFTFRRHFIKENTPAEINALFFNLVRAIFN